MSVLGLISSFIEDPAEDEEAVLFVSNPYLWIVPPVPGLTWLRGFIGVLGAFDLSYFGHTLSCFAIRSEANFLLQYEHGTKLFASLSAYSGGSLDCPSALGRGLKGFSLLQAFWWCSKASGLKL